MQKKENLTFVGIVLSLALVVTGIVILCQNVSWHSYGTSNSATFGADFYTYIYGAAQQITHNTYTEAAYLSGIFNILKIAFGMGFIIAGLFSGMHFLKEDLPFKKETSAEVNVSAAAETTAPVAEVCEEAEAPAAEVCEEAEVPAAEVCETAPENEMKTE